MKLIKPSFEILDQQCGLEGIYKQIEIAGRTCYKSEDKITEDSAKEFVNRMIKSGHGAMLEHGTVYLEFHVKDPSIVGEDEYHNQQGFLNKLINKYVGNKYSIVKVNHYYDTAFITTNYRVLVENNWLDDLKYLCEPTSFHEKRICVRFICDRGVSHEFVRHRVFSFAQESTRYCNYSKNKFNHEITFIEPSWLYNEWNNDDNIAKDYFRQVCEQAESYYFSLLKEGWKPQEARAVLPNALKTELVMTGFVSDWKHFFELRDAVSAHPQAQELAYPLHEAFIQRGLVK